MDKSQYFGVYNNTNQTNSHEVPYRAAIRTRPARDGKPAQYLNVGYFKHEKAAAAMYNIYSIEMFKGKAIINKMDLNEAERAELDEFIAKNPKRAERKAKAIQVVRAVQDAGNYFRTHLEFMKPEPQYADRVPF